MASSEELGQLEPPQPIRSPPPPPPPPPPQSTSPRSSGLETLHGLQPIRMPSPRPFPSFQSLQGVVPSHSSSQDRGPATQSSTQGLQSATQIEEGGEEIARLSSKSEKLMRLLRLLRERREVARDTKEKVDNYNQKLQEVQALEKKLAEVEEEQRIDAAQDPRLARLHNLKRVLKEGQIINQFTGLNPIGEPDAHKAAMEEQGIPEHIREQVISQREANIEEARRRLEELWKDDPEPPRNPLP